MKHKNSVESESSLGSDSDMENHHVIQIEQQACHLEWKPCSMNMMLI